MAIFFSRILLHTKPPKRGLIICLVLKKDIRAFPLLGERPNGREAVRRNKERTAERKSFRDSLNDVPDQEGKRQAKQATGNEYKGFPFPMVSSKQA